MEQFENYKSLFKNMGYSEEQLELIKAIEKARIHLEECRGYFEEVMDPRLIDYAIYMEEAAKVRYMYLLSEARRLDIKVSHLFKADIMSVG